MKQEIYPPLRLLKEISSEYSKAWEQMEMFHNENGKGDLPSWPDWCYAPMSAALAVASERSFVNDPEVDRFIHVGYMQAISALAPWRLSKEVYVIDPDLKELLFEQENDLNIPSEIFLQLPYQCFYIELPNTDFGAQHIHGCFISLEYDVNNRDRELRLTFLTTTGNVFGWPIHIDAGSISESVDLMNRQAMQNADSPELKKKALYGIQYADYTKKFLKQILQVVLYILAQNAEITPNSEQVMIMKRGSTIKDKYSEIRKWDVGIRIGAAIRQQKAFKDSGHSKKGNGVHNSPRPHMRRGHWHHFWTGAKSQPEERKLILKWLSPMAVAANPEDTPVVIHEVK